MDTPLENTVEGFEVRHGEDGPASQRQVGHACVGTLADVGEIHGEFCCDFLHHEPLRGDRLQCGPRKREVGYTRGFRLSHS